MTEEELNFFYKFRKKNYIRMLIRWRYLNSNALENFRGFFLLRIPFWSDSDIAGEQLYIFTVWKKKFLHLVFGNSFVVMSFPSQIILRSLLEKKNYFRLVIESRGIHVFLYVPNVEHEIFFFFRLMWKFPFGNIQSTKKN